MVDAPTEGTSLLSDQPGPGRLCSPKTEIGTYREHVARLTAAGR
ncbi:hypothetical protein [Streptomyces angustmyceticus]